MQLTGLTALVSESPAYRQAVAQIGSGNTHLNIIRAARPYILAALAQDWAGPVIYVTARIKRAYNVTEQLPVWLGDTARIQRFAEPTPMFYEHAPWGELAIRSRIEALCALMPPGDQTSGPNPIIVTSARGLMQRTMPVKQFRDGSLVLKRGGRILMDRLLGHLVAVGYEPVTVVIEPGTFSRRGGLVDIFPVAYNQPVRIDFFDDEIDTIRQFDVSSQLSQTPLDSIAITPAREALPAQTESLLHHLQPWFNSLPEESDILRDIEPLSAGSPFPHLEYYLPYLYPNSVSLFDYAPPETLIIIEDPSDLRETVEEVQAQAQRVREEQQTMSRLASDYPQPYLDWSQIEAAMEGRTIAYFDLESPTFAGVFKPGGRFGGQLRPAMRHIRDLNRQGAASVVVSQQTARLSELWTEGSTEDYVPVQRDVTTPPDTGSTVFVNGTLQEGWTLNLPGTTVNLITDAELFGWSRPEPRRRQTRRATRLPEAEFADWQEGDFVVHVDYGIGQFAGMKHRTIEGIEREYLLVEYGGTDKLYVPIHQADRLTKYVGADDTPPALSKLGQPDWNRLRSRAKKAVEEEAKELLELYAQRAGTEGHAYSPDDHWQRELEASFPYVETEDQLRAVREVKGDMEQSMPMDRLICGDVGFGKTEVALRAAFKAVNDGKQVAVLVPTTILAQQHYETFTNRLVNFPVKVELMSRFRSKEEQTRVLPKIASGEVDIVIGTHRILSSDITFKDLGLIIIDEEQRFGVKQKEHFKQLRTQVDVLTLTATPIPRTLYMSLTGVRDISMIQTPPEERLPVVTHVGVFDENLVRQAITRELERGGQIFVVHNRIRTIDHLTERLEDIVPEARIVTAHGQMNERQLEKVMSAFARGEFDVLVSTAIIESGIDIPNANTLIVDRADWFGLAQLYQLRGRVGRSAQQAYAYLFFPTGGRITEEARARLDTLAENTGLGAGFQISMRDLEIRGAGDILSTKQTGHVSAIGLHLYTQLLTQAVQKLKGKQPDEYTPAAAQSSIIMNLPLPAYLPEDWIPEIALRLQIYRRIANLTTRADVQSMRDELADRFGALPRAVEGLLYQMEVKLLALKAHATAIIAEDEAVRIKLPYLVDIDRDALARELGDGTEVTRVAVELPLGDPNTWRTRLLTVLQMLGTITVPEPATES